MRVVGLILGRINLNAAQFRRTNITLVSLIKSLERCIHHQIVGSGNSTYRFPNYKCAQSRFAGCSFQTRIRFAGITVYFPVQFTQKIIAIFHTFLDLQKNSKNILGKALSYIMSHFSSNWFLCTMRGGKFSLKKGKLRSRFKKNREFCNDLKNISILHLTNEMPRN